MKTGQNIIKNKKMPPPHLEPPHAPSTYYTDIIRNNFRQVQEAYFGTTIIITEEDKLSCVIKMDKNTNKH